MGKFNPDAPNGNRQPVLQKLAAMGQQVATATRKAAADRAARAAAEAARDDAERRYRTMDVQFAAVRARLARAEALLRSLGHEVPAA